MKKETKKEGMRGMEELVKPIRNQIFVELIEEEEKFSDKIYKPKNSLSTEPFCRIIAVGEQIKSLVPGDLGLMRSGVGADVFTLREKKYALLTEFDITAVIDSEIADEMRKHVKEKTKSIPLSD